jgi:two-component system, NtrC family, response regulator AtoC
MYDGLTTRGAGMKVVGELAGRAHAARPIGRRRTPLRRCELRGYPDALLEPELFGHGQGAFTGAIARKPGLVEVTDKGSIFLDEIREMNLALQAKLLTSLYTQTFQRVGAVKPIRVDVRFIASTNKILLSEVKAGKFCEDLYYRL